MQDILLLHQKCSYSLSLDIYIYIYIKNQRRQIVYKLFHALRFMFALYIHFFLNFDFIL